MPPRSRTRVSFKLDPSSAQGLARILDGAAERAVRKPAAIVIAEAGKLAKDYAEKRAPRGERNQIAGGIRLELHAEAVRPYATVTPPAATGQNGFRAAFALNASERYHRRKSAPSGRKGTTTKGWLSKIPGLVRGQLRRAQKRAEEAAQRALDGGR